ncbi:MAG TPA: hypothetical protein PKW07_00380 [Syntrophorhabdaceae bacterium]|nr:hypothetical protein [Syntrophorhabdaceae bacterium]
MWKAIHPGGIKDLQRICLIIISIILLCSCSMIKQFNLYTQGIEEGKRYIKNGEYEKARPYFELARKQLNYYLPLVYLSYIDFKANRIDDALGWIEEAERKMVADEYNLRLLGYKALILLKKDRVEGLKALNIYLENYERVYPLISITEVIRMRDSGDIDEKNLERLIQEQVEFYEDGIEQFLNTRTGPFEGIYGITGDI